MSEYRLFSFAQAHMMQEYAYITHLIQQAPAEHPDVKLKSWEAQQSSMTKTLQDVHERFRERIRKETHGFPSDAGGMHGFPSNAEDWSDEQKEIVMQRDVRI